MKILIGRCFKRICMIILIVLALSALQSSASTLVGDSIQASLIFPSNHLNHETLSSNSATVGSGSEFTIISGLGTDLFHVDIGNNFIEIAIASGVTMTSGFSKQLKLTGIDWFGEPSLTIDSVSLVTGKTTSYFPDPIGIDTGDITFDDHSLTFEYGLDAYWTRTSWAKITLTPSTSEDDPPPQIPEPSTIFIFGFGLLGIAGINRKR